MSKQTENKCYNCGHNGLKYYDGAIGYDALVCPKCNTYHDPFGVWYEDQFKRFFSVSKNDAGMTVLTEQKQ